MIQLRPSASHIWTNCPGYPHLVARLPAGEVNRASDPAREGTCAAWVAECTLRKQVVSCSEMLGLAHGNGWIVDQQMVEYCQDYVDLLVSRYGDAVRAEVSVRLNDFIGGTPDGHALVQHAPMQWTLAVDDLKYGYEIVEPWENPQVMIYAGALARNAQIPAGHQITRVIIGIYQPRPFHPLGPYRTWEPSIVELSDHLERIILAGNMCQSPDAVCIPGSHCRRCDAAHTCAAVAHELYRVVSTMHNNQQRYMTSDEMSRELDFLDVAGAMLKGRRDAVEAEAEARIQRGEVIPGWTTERGQGKRRWKFDTTTVKLLTGVDPSDDKMVTPAELERRGASKEIVKMLTETPRTAPKLMKHSRHIVAARFGG